MEEFRATFRIGEKDAVAFYIYQAIRTRFAGVLGFGILGLVICGIYGSAIIESKVLLIGAMIISFAVAAAVTMLGMYYSILGKVRRSRKHDPNADAEQTIIINGYGIRTESGDNEVRIGFDKVKSVRETGKAFYIYIGKEKAWILPKTALRDAEKDCVRLRELFDMVIPSAQLKLKK